MSPSVAAHHVEGHVERVQSTRVVYEHKYMFVAIVKMISSNEILPVSI